MDAQTAQVAAPARRHVSIKTLALIGVCAAALIDPAAASAKARSSESGDSGTHVAAGNQAGSVAEPNVASSAAAQPNAQTSPSAAPVPAAPVAPVGAEPPVQVPQPAPTSEIVITGTRLTSGFNAPTPVQALGEQQLEHMAAPNVYDAVQQLPAIMGSRGTGVGNGGTSSGNNGLSVLSTRGLAPIRTLTLLDGLRVAPADINGVVDVSLFPQLLIQRVDVVTGGASASYGSDAVGGVVNFILNDKFTGFKANLQAGETNYSDDKNILAQVAWGTGFADDRAHITLSGEYFNNEGVPARPAGTSGGPDGRTWFILPQVATRTIAQTPAGQPEYFLFAPTQYNKMSYGGLITSGPLEGTAFGPGGQPYQFQYGSPCIGSYCEGGENSANVLLTNSWDAKLRRALAYGRLSYDLTPGAQLYATFSYAEIRTLADTNAGARQEGNLTIQCDNAFLPQSIVNACAADGITSFGYGVSNLIFPANINVETHRKQPRFVVGLDGKKVSIFGKPWNLQVAYEHGQTNVALDIHNIMLIPRYKAAIDAIQLANGTIVCRDPVARAAGCVPLDIIGINPVNPAAWNYIAPEQGPRVRTSLKEDFGTVSLSGAPVRNWAGDVSVAFGAEWRKESYLSRADWYGAGLSADSPANAMFPADPVLVQSGGNWYAGNYSDGQGSYSVKEAFAEIGMPLFDSPTLGNLNVDAAGRVTDYSTSGTVFTWKAGSVWETPLNGLRLRGVVSRDIRAPNLSELFPPQKTQNQAGLIDNRTGNTKTVQAITIGNPNLKPEVANNLEIGAVYGPSWLRGLHASVDYYHINLKGAISALTAQQTIDLCQISGNQDACKLINLDGVLGTSNPPYVIVAPLNLASVKTSGIDLVASYTSGLRRFGIPGSLSILAQATHVFKFVEDTGVPGQPTIYAAGNNSALGGNGYTSGDFGVVPKWKGLVTETWSSNKIELTLAQRFVSAGYINPSWIQCTPGSCPTPTIQHPTIDRNRLPGAVYLDVGASYNITSDAQVYAKVDNVFDRSPPPYGAPTVYDWLGRVYRVGLRINTGG